MGNKPDNSAKVTLRDSKDSVQAEIVWGDGQALSFTHRDPKPIRVRLPVPDDVLLHKRLKGIQEKVFPGLTLREVVDGYAKDRNREIASELTEIRRCLKRIRANVACIEVANRIREKPKEKL